MEEQIREAIELLDHSNDDHWDARNGKPSLSVVRSLVGDRSITREQIETAAPAAIRQSPEGGGAADGVADDSREAVEARLSAHLAALDERKREALDRATSAKAEADAIEREKEEARAEFARRFPPLTEAQKHKMWVQRQVEERRKDAERREAASSVLTGAAPSPLDQAMAARRGHGMQRPSYPPARIGGGK